MQREFTTDNAEDMCYAMCDNVTPEELKEELKRSTEFSKAINAVLELGVANKEFTDAYNDLLKADNPKMLLAYEQLCEEKLASVIYAKLREIKEVHKHMEKEISKEIISYIENDIKATDMSGFGRILEEANKNVK